MKKTILFLLFLIFTLNIINASDWVGGVGNWSDPNNWNPVGVPTATDDVTIYNGEVTVDVDAYAKSVVFQGTSFTVNSGVTLTIENSAYYGLRCNGGDVTNNGSIVINTSDRNGILNQGTGDITNNGTITINGTTGFYHGIDNRVGFINSATGVINIDNTEDGSGIYNAPGTQIFWNEGEINIGLSDDIGYYGIDNRAEFYNNGAIDIGSASGTIGRGGVFNEADAVKFTNDAGSLTINNAGTNFSGIDNRSVFDNDNNSPITMGANVYRGIDNNGGTFNNIDGTISIAKISDSAILNRNSASFTNQSIMDFSGNTTANKPCLDSRASFSNTGIIDINDSQGQGIVVYAGSSFSNTGTGEINIGNTASIAKNGLDNNGTFTNGGTLNIGSASSIGGRGLYSTGTFNNDEGTINIDNTTTQALYNNGGTFNNINIAEINIGLVAHCGHRGIDNNGTFLNEDVSGIYIKDVQYESIYTTNGVFSNYGTYKQVLPTGSFWAISGASGSSFINKSTGEIYSGKAINGNYFTNEGALNPGNSPGKLQINNNYNGNAGSKLNIEIGGTTPETEYDQLNFQNLATDDISNTDLVVSYINGYTPSGGESFDIVVGNGFSGQFNSITRPAPPANYQWQDTYNSTTYTMSLVSIVPLDFISFNAKEYNNNVKLQWTTASEISNKGFEIHRSFDGLLWEKIAWVEGKNNRGNNKYVFIDKSQTESLVYYRLKQIDIDGNFQYSDIAQVKLSFDKFKIFPNPASDYIFIEQNKEMQPVSICDMKGETYILPNISGNKYDISHLKKGIYFIKSQTEIIRKLIVK